MHPHSFPLQGVQQNLPLSLCLCPGRTNPSCSKLQPVQEGPEHVGTGFGMTPAALKAFALLPGLGTDGAGRASGCTAAALLSLKLIGWCLLGSEPANRYLQELPPAASALQQAMDASTVGPSAQAPRKPHSTTSTALPVAPVPFAGDTGSSRTFCLLVVVGAATGDRNRGEGRGGSSISPNSDEWHHLIPKPPGSPHVPAQGCSTCCDPRGRQSRENPQKCWARGLCSTVLRAAAETARDTSLGPGAGATPAPTAAASHAAMLPLLLSMLLPARASASCRTQTHLEIAFPGHGAGPGQCHLLNGFHRRLTPIRDCLAVVLAAQTVLAIQKMKS